MGLFSKKDPMEKWRSRNKLAASFVDHSGWDVNLELGVVHTVIDATTVTVLIPDGSSGVNTMVIIEAGAQADRTMINTFGDDGGDPYEFEGWKGNAAPGSGLMEGHVKVADSEFYDKIVAAANDLVAHITAT